MLVIETNIKEVKLIKPAVYRDARGCFLETWNEKSFSDAGLDRRFVQDNHSQSVKGTLRGLHYQIDRPQGKLVHVVVGEIFDVAVDIRRSSPTFGRWVGVRLSADNRDMLWIPEGFAHGFYVTSEVADVCYKCTDFYAPGGDRTILWNDPDLNINWPLTKAGTPLLSVKDGQGALLLGAELYA